MPNYEYECRACGYRFEKFQNINDDPLRICPKCRGEIRRLITGGGGVIFKGSGFYATDYKKSRDEAGPCCGTDQSCDNPKRCCGR